MYLLVLITLEKNCKKIKMLKGSLQSLLFKVKPKLDGVIKNTVYRIVKTEMFCSVTLSENSPEVFEAAK